MEIKKKNYGALWVQQENHWGALRICWKNHKVLMGFKTVLRKNHKGSAGGRREIIKGLCWPQ